MFKYLTMVLVAFVLMVSVASAQKLPGDIAGKKADKLNKQLVLNKDQYTKVYQSYLKAETEISKLNKKDKTYKASVGKINTTAKTEIEKVLTKEQVKKFNTPVKKHKKHYKKKTVVKNDVNKTEVKKEVKKTEVKKDEKKTPVIKK